MLCKELLMTEAKNKNLLFNFIWTFISFIFVILIMELFLRLLPVVNPIPLKDTNYNLSENEIAGSFLPNRKGNHSLGRDFYVVNQYESNNFGFVSNIDYQLYSSPKFAVIGDSYVEAVQVPYEQSFAGRIQNKFGSDQVYSFGISGAPLSQYLEFADYAEKNFSPKSYIFIVVGNDFDESLCDYALRPGFSCFDKNFSLKAIPNEPTWWGGRLLRASSLVRYIVFNLQIDPRSIFSSSKKQVKYAGNTEFKKPKEVVDKSVRAIEVFFNKLKKITKDKPVYFIFDSEREKIYSGSTQGVSYFSEMRKISMKKALEENYFVIDMENIFIEDYKINKKKFEFRTDGHWNSYSHNLVATSFNTIYNDD